MIWPLGLWSWSELASPGSFPGSLAEDCAMCGAVAGLGLCPCMPTGPHWDPDTPASALSQKTDEVGEGLWIVIARAPGCRAVPSGPSMGSWWVYWGFRHGGSEWLSSKRGYTRSGWGLAKATLAEFLMHPAGVCTPEAWCKQWATADCATLRRGPGVL